VNRGLELALKGGYFANRCYRPPRQLNALVSACFDSAAAAAAKFTVIHV